MKEIKEITKIKTALKTNHISIKGILTTLSGKGKFLILILLTLPFCQPIPLPGLSTPFGLMISLIGLKMVFRKNIRLPKSILEKKIPTSILKKTIDKFLHLTRKMNHYLHPRFDWICRDPFLQIVNGLTIFLLGIFLALPLPIPFSNTIFGWALLLMGLGLFKENGILVISGYTIALLAIGFFSFLFLYTVFS